MKLFLICLFVSFGINAFGSCDRIAHEIARQKFITDYMAQAVGSFILESKEDTVLEYYMAVFDLNSSLGKYVKLNLKNDCSLVQANYIEKEELPWPWNEN